MEHNNNVISLKDKKPKPKDQREKESCSNETYKVIRLVFYPRIEEKIYSDPGPVEPYGKEDWIFPGCFIKLPTLLVKARPLQLQDQWSLLDRLPQEPLMSTMFKSSDIIVVPKNNGNVLDIGSVYDEGWDLIWASRNLWQDGLDLKAIFLISVISPCMWFWQNDRVRKHPILIWSQRISQVS